MQDDFNNLAVQRYAQLYKHTQTHTNTAFTTQSNGRDGKREEEKKAVISPLSLRVWFVCVSQLERVLVIVYTFNKKVGGARIVGVYNCS